MIMLLDISYVAGYLQNGARRTEMTTTSTFGISLSSQGGSNVYQLRLLLWENYPAYWCNMQVQQADSENIYVRRQGQRVLGPRTAPEGTVSSTKKQA
jgi:hypothetical protein